jgi:hypothetical protein
MDIVLKALGNVYLPYLTQPIKEKTSPFFLFIKDSRFFGWQALGLEMHDVEKK